MKKSQVERLDVFLTVPYEPSVDKQKRAQGNSKSLRLTKRFGNACEELLEWHELHGRHELPWRNDHNPYAVLVSEFMLQQTSVTTVIPRFHGWMRRFPTINDLAEAGEQEVLAAWEGLGYYSRARRLHAVARTVMEMHGGTIPVEESVLLSLPGIGVYTAAAIRAFAHDQHSVVLDTNICRVIARWGNMSDPIDTALGRKNLISIAGGFFSTTGSRTMASALMDLGATICKSDEPDCTSCPLQKTCTASDPKKLPRKPPRSVTTKLVEHRAWFWKEGRLYLEHSPGPRWRGLWIFPKMGNLKSSERTLSEITYPITRYRITMKLHRVNGPIPPELKGFSLPELGLLPMPSPFRKVIVRLLFGDG
jgi:A/G-specific adenine glycosylase